LAREAGYALPHLALAWVLRQPSVSLAIIGASRPEQVAENARAADLALSDELARRIDEALGDAVRHKR
jgi:aryl-alcohol dehydrogenase-like predicted oxidoreductase